VIGALPSVEVALLVGIAFVAGMVTAISPCILPVLPILFAGTASGGRRRPLGVIAGLILSFTAFTLAATALLSALGLPQDLLRNIAIGVVIVVGLSLLLPRLGHLLERPFYALGRRRPSEATGGLVLGVSLGLLATPCAGPVIAAIATVAATQRFSASAVFVTLAYAFGMGLVLLALALAARRGLQLAPLRRHAPAVRRALGVLMVAAAVVIALGLDTRLARNVPGYTQALQGLEDSAAAATRIDSLVGRKPQTIEETKHLQDFGKAPDFQGVTLWLNSKPLTLAELRGKVVLIDFWTYSCVNCLRTLSYLQRWYETYRDDGFVIVGVHSPEFAFEREPANVRRAIADLGVTWPVALDNSFETWNAWGNQYWPAKYFVDRKGHVRFAHFGEGDYAQSEAVIRQLLAEPGLPPPVSGQIRDQTPSSPQTPESYLGYGRLARLVGDPVVPDKLATYELPGFVPQDSLAFGGQWRIEEERAVAGRGARLRLHFRAGQVFLVLTSEAGAGDVEVTVDGKRAATVHVDGPRLYTLTKIPPEPGAEAQYHMLDLAFTPGLAAYAFTFGS
jgi:cytochrome c biogenesis protein CcdA/thiol-disulfide isomerase/thioredoxin